MSDHPAFKSIRPTQTLARVGIAIVVVVAFLVTASVITPDSSHATEGLATDPEGLPEERMSAPLEAEAEILSEESDGNVWPDWLHDSGPESGTADLPSLGTISSREYVVQIHATPEGPRYTVFDIKGRVIGRNMLPAEVRRAAPDLNLDTLMADTGLDEQFEMPTQIMLAVGRELFE